MEKKDQYLLIYTTPSISSNLKARCFDPNNNVKIVQIVSTTVFNTGYKGKSF